VLTFDLAQHSCCIFTVGCINSKWGWKTLYCILSSGTWNFAEYIFFHFLMLWSHAVLSPLSLWKQQFIPVCMETAILLRKEWGGAVVGRRGAERERERERRMKQCITVSRVDSCRFPGSRYFVLCSWFDSQNIIVKAPDSCHVFPLSLRLPVWNTKAWSFKSLESERNWQLFTFDIYTVYICTQCYKMACCLCVFPLHAGLSCHINY